MRNFLNLLFLGLITTAQHIFDYTDASASLSTLTLHGPPQIPEEWTTLPLNRALASFSIETAYFDDYLGNVSHPNTMSINLLQNLKERAGIAPQIRIGGITADSMVWDPDQKAALHGYVNVDGGIVNTTVGPQFWHSVKLLPKGTQVIITLNLESMNYTGTLDMARAAWAGLGPGMISRFEIGNEPDHYPLDFDAVNYTSIWEPWSISLSKELNISRPIFQIGASANDPLWPYDTVRVDGQLDCVSALAAGANDGNTIKTCSEHTYQYSVCDSARAEVATLSNLVNHTRLAMYLDLWQPRIHVVRSHLGPDSFMIGEFNSISCGGKDDVSNTFGQALWLLDTTLYAASINVSRLYVHQGLSFYNLWNPVDNLRGPNQVFPAYYAYLFVSELIGGSKSLRTANIFPGRQVNGSSITTAGGDPSAGQFAIYGYWGRSHDNYPSKLAIINLQIYNSTTTHPRPNVTVDFSAFLEHQQQRVTARTMIAPGAEVKSGNRTTWAGQTFASRDVEGKLVEDVIMNGRIDVVASSAVLINL